jgi:hypothetical protein
VERKCKDCGKPLKRRKGRGRQRERCKACADERKRLRDRDRYRETHPGWKDGKERQAQLQREYHARKKAARENLTDVTSGDTLDARDALDRAGLMRDRSVSMVPLPKRPLSQAELDKIAMLQMGHEGETSLLAEDDRNRRMSQAEKVLWEQPVYGDPLARKNEYGFGGWVVSEEDRLMPWGFAAIQAASGDALALFAKAKGATGASREHAAILIRWVTDQLPGWQQKMYAEVFRRLEAGEIQDAEGRPIVKRMKPSGRATEADALVDLALLEKGQRPPESA